MILDYIVNMETSGDRDTPNSSSELSYTTYHQGDFVVNKEK